MEKERRRLAAIMSADVAGYSRLMEADESGTLAALKRHREELLDPAITRHEGRIVGVAGDGLIAEFGSVVDAVRCAVEVQQAMAERNAAVPQDRRMELRIGVNVGDVIIDGDDIHGDGVNIAARLQQLAAPGGLSISGSARDHIGGKLPFAFDDAGDHAVKNITRPVRVFRLRREGAAPSIPQLLSSKLSIAVLPFANMSGDPEQEYFSDGITEDIITELSRFRELMVLARNSSFVFKGQAVDIVEIGRRLAVAYVVEGSVRKAGNRIRVTAQLVETATGSHLWAERYDRGLEDIFAVQDELVRAITATIPGRLESSSHDRAKRLSPDQLTAHDYVLKGRWATWHTTADHQGVIDLFRKALDLDPNSAAAHVGLASAYGYGISRLGLPRDVNLANSRRHVEAALAIDSGDPRIQADAGLTYLFYGEHALARLHSENALALNPNDIYAINTRGIVLCYAGELAAGLECLRLRDRLARIDPDTTFIEPLFDCYFMMGDDANAVATFQLFRAPVPHMYAEYAAALANLGRLEEAREAVANAVRNAPPNWDIVDFVRNHVRMCQHQKDADRWLDGYRKAGIAV